MGQVPKYLIIGQGRMARHLTHYLSALGLPWRQWGRETSDNTKNSADNQWATHILLAVSDRAIAEVAAQLHRTPQTELIHFSGALELEGVRCLHPVMTFGDTLYSPEFYKTIPWVVFDDRPFLPGLPNPVHRIPSEQKSHYHMLCVLGGNFTQLLWNYVTTTAQTQYGLAPEVFEPFAKQSLENIFRSPNATTGPLVRGDHETIEAHLDALSGSPYEDVYRAFVKAYQNRPLVPNPPDSGVCL